MNADKAETIKTKPAQEAVQTLSGAELDTVSGGSTDAGAGKVTFNPFSMVKHIDVGSPTL